MKKSYETRLREFEAAKRLLMYKELTPSQYEREVRKLAMKYGI